ncbi:MAG TPA: hypothetical protein VIF37_20490 [Methylobacter sp.]|jgi:hypothetical protein
MNINGIEVPEPITDYPAYGDTFYIADITCDESEIGARIFEERSSQMGWVLNRIAHASRDAALIHRKALLSFFVNEDGHE